MIEVREISCGRRGVSKVHVRQLGRVSGGVGVT